MYVVTGWATEIISGYGTLFPHKKGCATYENHYLFFPNGETTAEIVYQSDIFTDYGQAVDKLDREKKDYLRYYQEQLVKCNEMISKLSK